MGYRGVCGEWGNNCSPTLILGGDYSSPTADCSHYPQKQSCTAEAEAKRHNSEIAMPPNFRAKHGFSYKITFVDLFSNKSADGYILQVQMKTQRSNNRKCLLVKFLLL